ncbi:hypothetical protein A4G99_23305 [Haladaptatus sp. R4]|uniref:hypothetical protein n=1 Tax=Haladaptatus sp. R4 TaxID=1679489 RepID=UPI0007B4C9F1|nr:hypothetical protein [Haladaptatus sp. R4]KZN26096.1 hypothetical protein A4G99_23305 [Haladaptatus sp. R4]
MTNWAPDTDDDRIEHIVEDVRDRPEVADVEHDDETITISFDEQTTLPEGFDEWADANDLLIRDVEVRPEDDGFAVHLTFTDEVEALSSLRSGVDSLRRYLDADHSPATRRKALMAARGPFARAKWSRFRGGEPEGIDGFHAACNHLRHRHGTGRHPRSRFGDDDQGRFRSRQ